MSTMTTRTLPWYAVPWVLSGWRQLKRYPLVAVAILLFCLVIPAVFAPWVAPHDPLEGQLSHQMQGGPFRYTDEW